MLVLYETSLGYCLFKLTDSAKISNDNVWEDFETPEKANKLWVIRVLSHLVLLMIFVPPVRARSHTDIIKLEVEVIASLHVHGDCGRRNHCDSRGQAWKRP